MGVVAPVVLQIIDTPFGILTRVLKLISTAAGTVLAGPCTSIGVDAELQTLGVDVVSECLYAGRESLRIGNNVAVFVSTHLPAIVDHHILVPRVFETRRDHVVGNAANQLLAYIAAKFVPAVPAHGRRAR